MIPEGQAGQARVLTLSSRSPAGPAAWGAGSVGPGHCARRRRGGVLQGPPPVGSLLLQVPVQAGQPGGTQGAGWELADTWEGGPMWASAGSQGQGTWVLHLWEDAPWLEMCTEMAGV